MTVSEFWVAKDLSGASYLVALVGGALCAVFYFGGLWLTLRYTLGGRCPAVLVVLSFWARTAIVAAAIFVLADGRLERLILCVVALLATRALLLRLLPAPIHPAPLQTGGERI